MSPLTPYAPWKGRALARLGDVWLSAFGPVRGGRAVIRDFAPGLPTKVLVLAGPSLRSSEIVRGEQCSTASAHHFCYGQGACGFTGEPVPAESLERRGTPTFSVLPRTENAGYMLFGDRGHYRWWVEQGDRTIGSAIIAVE